MRSAPRQLLVYTFTPESKFEGQLVGALERIESGGAVRVLDVLFVGREPSTGELVALSRGAEGAGTVGALLSFRLDDHSRQKTTQRALDGPMGDAVRSLAAELKPGAAVAAIIVEHTWVRTLSDAVDRLGGTELVDGFVEAAELVEVAQFAGDAAAR